MKNMLLDNDREPTDKELAILMREVTKEVKSKALEAKIKLSKTIKIQVLEAKEKFKQKYA